MNQQRVTTFSNQSTKHVTYVMMGAFRVLDNHSLYYATTEYETCNIVLIRTREDARQNNYFNSFIPDLMSTLEQFGKVSLVYDVKDIVINNDIVIDKGYLKEEKMIEAFLKETSSYAVTTVETNVAVPVTVVSNKEEYSARTIRPRIYKHLYDFVDPVLEEYNISSFERQAIEAVNHYIDVKLQHYNLKNHPEFDYTSGVSKYLKYGIISPIRILILLEDTRNQNKESFIEELIIRRELSYNFVYYNPLYFDFNHITYEWAYKTMDIHQLDHKEYLYDLDDYITFNTHDKYFNAAMKEMVTLGKMHGYMRMYWCKKIMEWSPNFKYAYDTAIYLNNRYFLDGNTPNGYAGVAWCFGKHDRAWGERAIFGKLRYMNANGLKRKFEIDKYMARIESEVMKHESSKTDNTD